MKPDPLDWVDEVFEGAPTSERARRLRAVLEKQLSQLDPPELEQLLSEEAENRDVERLRFRLRKEGLIGRGATPSAWRRKSIYAGVAAVCVLAIGVSMWLPRQGADDDFLAMAPPVLRGEAPQNVIVSDKPRDVARLMADRLKQADAKPMVYVQNGTFTIDYQASPSHEATLTALFKGYFADAGPLVKDGYHRVVIRGK